MAITVIRRTTGMTKKAFLLGVASVITISSSPSWALQSDTQADKDEEKMVVTGTRIKKVDINNLSPILSISREDMDKQGFATVKDLVDSLTQNTGGTLDNSATFGFTPGASSVNLRGIGFGHTLILIDGRRLPIYPVGIGGTSNFVDLSSIPMAFVERIDVLTDGASAVYGSDAVSGVINVITRKDIEGISLNYRMGDSSDGGYSNKRLNLFTGARSGDTQVDLIIDLWDQNPVWASQRDYAASDLANPNATYSGGGASFYGLDSGNVYQHPDCGTPNDPLGGLGIPDVEVTFFNPGEIWCGFDRSAYRQLIAPQSRASVMSRLSYEVSPDLTVFGRVGFSTSQTKPEMEPNFYGGALFNGYGFSVPNWGAMLPAGAANNPTTGTAYEESGVFVRRLVEFGPRKSDIDSNAYNLLLGLEGTMFNGQYDWELGVSYNRTNLDITANNILLSALNQSVDLGLDLFQPIPDYMVDALSFTAIKEAQSINRVIDFSITGDTGFNLNAGPIKFALALEHVSEEYEDRPDKRVLLEDAFDGSSSGAGKREHTGIGGELSFPFSDNFELDLALRWDDYDDESSTDSAFSPRLAMAYRPTESILTRFSWGQSFRAPDMQRLFGGPTKGFSDILDPEFLIDSDGNLCPGSSTDPDCQPLLVQSVNTYTLSNIDLAEEEGDNFNLGVVWEPSHDFSVSVDYFRIELEEVVAAPSVQWVINVCTYYGYLCDFVSRDELGSLSGGDAFVATYAVNFAEQDTDGYDFTMNYDWQNSWGSWSSQANITWVKTFETRFTQDSEKVEEIGLGALPEFRTNLTLDWAQGSWGATLRMNFVDEMAGAYCFECGKDEYIDSWTIFSLSGRYNYSDFTRIRFGINNLTNEEPPTDPTLTNWPWFNNAGGYYSAVGREYYLQLETRF
ncbi:TonB-dependent receptor [Aliikangiella sp. G2MR2-5]|uniref:TonB-dependent receptor n=1 Tax=Aliikangiella sp. G2MR2-5 TaxID=2788943 RepID=UPI0018AB4B3F|nr:TonB-dependent receptor [Aliikangiella sp. G2MR2-5]